MLFASNNINLELIKKADEYLCLKSIPQIAAFPKNDEDPLDTQSQ